MAKLVIGTNKQTVVPAVVRDMSPEIYRVFRVNNGKIENSVSTPFLPLPSTATDIGDYCYYNAYKNTPASVLSGSIDLSSLTTISGQNACYYMFYSCQGITSVDLSSLTTISGQTACQYMFGYSDGITSANLGSLTTVSGYNACGNMLSRCRGLTSVDLSSLTTISGMMAVQSMFSQTGLTSVDLSSLTTISGQNSCWGMFGDCNNLTSCKMNKLSVMSTQITPSYGAMFGGCTKLESVELGGLKASTFSSLVNQIQYLFDSSYAGSQAPNGCTVHFPSNFDPSDPNHTFDASTLAGYPTFGGNASYIHVAFDLPATE